jgi:hypothetical protein
MQELGKVIAINLPSPPMPPEQHQGDGNGGGSNRDHPERHNQGEIGGEPSGQTQSRGNLRVAAYDIPTPAVKAVAECRHSTQANLRA